MDGFKKLPKEVACFKAGGGVYKSRHSEKSEVSKDIAQDKQIVKKAVSIHDKQLHEGEKTNLSKLKKGGRAKKEGGCVGRYKSGGTVENAYGTPKTKKDIKDIANTKRQKPKMADGGGVFDTLKNNVLGTPEQNAAAAQRNDKYLKAKMAQKAAGQKLGGAEEMALKMGQMGQKADALTGMGAVTDADRAMLPARKRGGKMCK